MYVQCYVYICLQTYTSVYKCGVQSNETNKIRQQRTEKTTGASRPHKHCSIERVGPTNRPNNEWWENATVSWAFFRKRSKAWLRCWRRWRCLVFATLLESIFVVVVGGAVFTFWRFSFVCLLFFFLSFFLSRLYRFTQCVCAVFVVTYSRALVQSY